MKLVKAALGVLLALAVVAGCFLLPERVLEWTAVQGIVGTGALRTAFGASVQMQEEPAGAAPEAGSAMESAAAAAPVIENTAETEDGPAAENAAETAAAGEVIVESETETGDEMSVVELLYQMHNSPMMYTVQTTGEAQDEALARAEAALVPLGEALGCSLETLYSESVVQNCMVLDLGAQQREIWDIALLDGQGQEIWMYLDGQSGCILMLHIQGDLQQAGVPLEPEPLLEAFCTVCLGVEAYEFYEVAQPSGDGHVYSLTVYDGGLEASVSMTLFGEVVSIG